MLRKLRLAVAGLLLLSPLAQGAPVQRPFYTRPGVPIGACRPMGYYAPPSDIPRPSPWGPWNSCHCKVGLAPGSPPYYTGLVEAPWGDSIAYYEDTSYGGLQLQVYGDFPVDVVIDPAPPGGP